MKTADINGGGGGGGGVADASMVKAFRTEPGLMPTAGLATFHYYGNSHWERFALPGTSINLGGTSCGPAAVATAVRFRRRDDLSEQELLGTYLACGTGPFGTDLMGIVGGLLSYGVDASLEWVRGEKEYIAAIRAKVAAMEPVIVLVDWGNWSAHYMVAYGATADVVLLSNMPGDEAPTNAGQSNNRGYTDTQLEGFVTRAHLLHALGFWNPLLGFALVSVSR